MQSNDTNAKRDQLSQQSAGTAKKPLQPSQGAHGPQKGKATPPKNGSAVKDEMEAENSAVPQADEVIEIKPPMAEIQPQC